MLTDIRIQGLRSLVDTDYIPIKPITILVGKNSSGKSTFARTFPLLRQSVEQRTKGPILWYGGLVDFGSFTEAVNNKQEPKEIIISFRIVVKKQNKSEYPSELGIPPTMSMISDGIAEVSLHVREESDGGTFASKVVVTIFGSKCTVSFKDRATVESIKINNLNIPIAQEHPALAEEGSLIPAFFFVQKRIVKESTGERTIWEIPKSNRLRDELEAEIRSNVHGRTTANKIGKIASALPIGGLSEILEFSKTISDAPSSWRANLTQARPDSKKISRLRDRIFAYRFRELLKTIDRMLSDQFNTTQYIEPIRATAQRYYRRQELAVDEIDPKGANVAMYLDSLSTTERSKFKSWMSDAFGISVNAVREGGHIAIKLRESDAGKEINLADMGFGFSQLIPIVIQLWATEKGTKSVAPRRRRAITNKLIIEQPELHLHPEFQARVGDIIARVAQNTSARNDNFAIIIETHSQHLINRLGQLIERQEIAAKNVQIVLFEQRHGLTKVSLSSFDDTGALIDWPYGFFEPDIPE